ERGDANQHAGDADEQHGSPGPSQLSHVDRSREAGNPVEKRVRPEEMDEAGDGGPRAREGQDPEQDGQEAANRHAAPHTAVEVRSRHQWVAGAPSPISCAIRRCSDSNRSRSSLSTSRRMAFAPYDWNICTNLSHACVLPTNTSAELSRGN